MQRLVGCAALAALSCLVASCGGGGGGGEAAAPLDSRPASKLFVGDTWNSALLSAIDPAPAAGTLVPDRSISGASTQIANSIHGLAADAANQRLYVATASTLLAFHDAGRANGNVAPTRAITSSGAAALALDTTRDILYAADPISAVKVFDGAGSVNGNVAPSRAISGTFGGSSFTLRGLAVDTGRDLLYVSVSTTGPSAEKVLVFANASTADGSTVTPARTIVAQDGINASQIFLDETADRLYLIGNELTIQVFDAASTLDGTVPASRVIDLGNPGFSTFLEHLTVDVTRDRLYATSAVGTLYGVEGASAASGLVTPTVLEAPDSGTFAAIAVTP